METKFKNFTATVAPIGERKMSFTISTAAVDRDGDTIDPKGWDLGSYTKNPVVLWAHDYSSPPVGKAVNIKSTDHGLQADVEFLPQGLDPFADKIHDMCKAGFLNATSVGFRGVEYDEASGRKGYDFKKQELLEFSIVPVPCNPEALAQRGLKNDQLKKYAKEMSAWSKSVLGESSPKMSQEQFDSLSGELAKILRETPEEKQIVTVQAPTVDVEEVAIAVAKILESKNQVISADVLDIEDVEGVIDFESLEKEQGGIEIDGDLLSSVLVDEMRKTFREMAGAQARAAINKLTGRLD